MNFVRHVTDSVATRDLRIDTIRRGRAAVRSQPDGRGRELTSHSVAQEILANGRDVRPVRRTGAAVAASPAAEALCVEKDNKNTALSSFTEADSGYNDDIIRAESRELCPRRSSPPRPSPPSRATFPHSDTDLPAAGAPARRRRPHAPARTAERGISRRRRLAMRRPAGARAATRARSWPGAAAGLLVLAAFLALPPQAQAQTVQTLVSNTGQTIDTSNGFVGVFEGRWSAAQGVTTGDSDAGYTLSSVDLHLTSTTGVAEQLVVSIYEGGPTWPAWQQPV